MILNLFWWWMRHDHIEEIDGDDDDENNGKTTTTQRDVDGRELKILTLSFFTLSTCWGLTLSPDPIF